MSDTNGGELHPAEVKKAEAEAAAALAQVAKFEAEAELFAAQAERTRAEIVNAAKTAARAERRDELAITREYRKEAEELAGDTHHHVYTFGGPVSADSVKKCIDQLNSWRRRADGQSLDIEIVFNSPGGSVTEGMALFDYIQVLRREGHHITTVAMGLAASMAGILLQAGDVRVIGSESYMMIHEVSMGAVGKIGDIEDTVEFGNMIQKRIIDIFADRSTMSKAVVKRRMARKNWWIDSAQALKLGLVDEVR